MVEAFAAAVLAGEPVPSLPDDAVRNMRVIDALLRATDTEQTVAVAE